ncbi:MAG: YbbR-like domain-containing protein [Candidatus Mcinerneyibacterium aminivorans]|uniref:YbbR-like domain-containing protein n=1 Tax=Candidatus Mcinerneyibacterium aminivorans TaxID=2703815 RepID=A0A5D0MFJ6_9BACT|nr:MAG: YbbR-like domain-containing protein [Candidatus Mcinerneyibacterium aminivorans]
MPKKGKNSLLYKIFINNFNYKLLALAITLLWWFATVDNRIIEETIKIPIKFNNLSKNMVIADYTPQKLEFEVKAKGKQISELKKRDLFYSINLNNYEKGNYEFEVNKYNIENVDNYSLIKDVKKSKKIQIVVDEKVEKFVKIEPKIVGELPRDYKLIGEIEIIPEYVKIKGPKSVNIIETYPIDISDINKTIKKEVNLQLPPYTTLVAEKNKNIFANIKVTELKSLEIDNIKINVKGDYSLIYPKVISLEIRVPVSINRESIKSNIDVSIDLTGYDKGDYNIIPTINIPGDFELIDYKPKDIRVIIR